MRKLLSVVLAAATVAGGFATAGAADARERGRYYDRYDGRYDGRYYRRQNDDGAAVAAGIAGLIIGSALASGSNSRTYYDNRGYYAPRYGYSYYEPRYRRCRTVTSWDPYYGGYVRQTRCW